MKHWLNLLFCSIFFIAGHAQKVDLDRYYFSASYRDLPRLGVDTSFRTFSLETGLSQNAAYMMRDEQPEENIHIIGWRKVRSRGDLLVSLQMDDIAISNSEVKEREEILKDKTGKETGRRYYYHMELRYTFAARARVSDRRGAQLIDRILADRQVPRVYNTKECASSNEALNSFVSNVFAVTSAITSFEVNQAVNGLNGLLDVNLGYSQRTVSDFLWILDSKKHPEYRDHREAWTSFKQAMFQMRADRPLADVAAQLRPVIAYFQKMKTRYNSDSKADRKMRYASYYNLAKIYYYLDDPEDALAEAGQLMINNYDEKDGRTLEAAALGLQQIFELNKIHTRHFPVDNDIASGSISAGY